MPEAILAEKSFERKFQYFIEHISRHYRALVRIEIISKNELSETTLVILTKEAVRRSGNFQKITIKEGGGL